MNLLKDPNKRKWVIVATMFIAIICNYLDRQLLSILKPEILEHFGIGDMQYAWIVNVFLICYALMYPVSGILVDRFGPKRVMLAGIAVWSLACIGGGLAQTVWQFAVCRGILGLAEPTIFAGQLVAVTLWFEKRQRATANSLCTVGGSLGAVIAPLVIACAGFRTGRRCSSWPVWRVSSSRGCGWSSTARRRRRFSTVRST